jgi:hypothetical protein
MQSFHSEQAWLLTLVLKLPVGQAEHIRSLVAVPAPVT